VRIVRWAICRARKYVNRKGFIAIHETDDLIRELLERWLGEAGYSVHPVAGESPRLVIADMPSPDVAPSRIEAMQAVYAAPVLVLSGRFRRGLGGSAEAARRLGVRKVLPKPFTRKELLSAVDEMLEGAE
jgi:DNA-binding response OmpR family regulator